MFDSDQPELQAFRELEPLVRHLADELAVFRRRALTAEARLRELEGPGENGDAGPSAPALHARVEELERENALLRGRIESAGERVRQMFDRVHFLRQQAQQAPQGAGGGAER